MKTFGFNMWIVVNCCDLIREKRNIPVRYKRVSQHAARNRMGPRNNTRQATLLEQ